jgi:predicted neuraminidase
MKTFSFLIALLMFTSLSAQHPFSGTDAIVKAEFVYKNEDVSFPSCHASTVAETSDGLIAAWFGGTAEKNPDVCIWASRFTNGKWTIPVEVANGIQDKTLRYPTWNPALFNTGKEIILFYKVGPDPSEWWGEYITSADDGKTWSQPTRLPDQILGPVKDKPVLLSNGDLLCPSSTENNGWKVHMEITPDFGKTWERTESLKYEDNIGAIQPTILFHKNGKLQTLCRSQNKMIVTAWSEDNGRNWTKLEPTSLPNPNSGIDAVTLKAGRQVLIYNHIKPAKRWGDRNILNMAVSDDGINWKAAVLLENDPNKDAEYSYPAVIQSKDGLIHITYTWNRKRIKHVVVEPAKLKTKPITNGEWPVL